MPRSFDDWICYALLNNLDVFDVFMTFMTSEGVKLSKEEKEILTPLAKMAVICDVDFMIILDGTDASYDNLN
jgi:hypothetical protein